VILNSELVSGEPQNRVFQAYSASLGPFGTLDRAISNRAGKSRPPSDERGSDFLTSCACVLGELGLSHASFLP
jgi:hypothetical protein